MHFFRGVIHEWMSSVFEVLFLFWLVVMSWLSSWYEIDVCVELLADGVWESEDDKTGFLSVGVDIFDPLYLKKWPISLPMMQLSTKNEDMINDDKWESSTNRKMGKSKNVKQLILINVQNIFYIHPFLLKEYNLFSQNIESCLGQQKWNPSFLKKVNNSIATKLWANLLDNSKKTFLVHNTIQWLNFLVHYLNVKINWKLVGETNAQLFSALKLDRVYKKWTSWAGKVLRHIVFKFLRFYLTCLIYIYYKYCADRIITGNS